MSAALFDPAPRAMTPREFAALRAMILERAGIDVVPAKQALLEARLTRRLRALAVPTFGAYIDRVRGDAAEAWRMLEAVTTHETSFFREPHQFELLEQRILPRWRLDASRGLRSMRIRAWSAACATGEEPYSLAMALLHHLPPAPSPAPSWDHAIVATDLSEPVLARARDATYPAERAREIPARYRTPYLLKGVGPRDGAIRVGPAARGIVQFARMNLHDEAWPIGGELDLIFCRNVLIYFARAARDRVIRRLVEHLAPGGFLFLGHAESLHGEEGVERTEAPNVYVRPGARGAPR